MIGYKKVIRMDETYREAMAEVDYIISFLESEKYNKIPTKLLEIIKREKSNTYIPIFDANKSYDEQNFTPEVVALLAILNKYIKK